MKNIAWRALAWVISRRPIADYLIGRATRTPYFHLNNYMNRYWLFNRYSEIGSWNRVPLRFPRLPSVRIHHILRADRAEHMHDHPWDARTIILRGGYTERRPTERPGEPYELHMRRQGDTAPVEFGQYHHIERVPPLGAWTLFITWRYVGTWGFLVDGEKVPYQTYLAQHPEREA